MARFYAVGIVMGCLGIGNMFQSNQAYVQFVNVTGGPSASWFNDKGWLFGLLIAAVVALVIIGGIRSIAASLRSSCRSWPSSTLSPL